MSFSRPPRLKFDSFYSSSLGTCLFCLSPPLTVWDVERSPPPKTSSVSGICLPWELPVRHCLCWQPPLRLKPPRQILVLTARRSDAIKESSLFSLCFLRSPGSAWSFTKPERRISRCWRAQRGFSWPPIVWVRSLKLNESFLTGRSAEISPAVRFRFKQFVFLCFFHFGSRGEERSCFQSCLVYVWSCEHASSLSTQKPLLSGVPSCLVRFCSH